MPMDPVDLRSLESAVGALERPTFAMRIVNLIGMPIEAATKLLPAKASAIVARATTMARKTAICSHPKTVMGVLLEALCADERVDEIAEQEGGHGGDQDAGFGGSRLVQVF